MNGNEFGKTGTLSELDIDDLLLNKENFRIDFNSGSTEADVVKKLFEEEEIIEMAEDIVSFGGLYPHENLLVVHEAGKTIVLEGNRRTLAIKCLVNQSLVPTEYKQKFKERIGTISDDFISKVRRVNVAFVGSRQDALRIIADKHSDIGFRKWGQVSQWNFVKTVFDMQGKDATKTAEFLGTEKSTVINYCKYHNLLAYIRGLGFWDDEKLRGEINKNRLEPTRMTRALGFTDINNSLGLTYTNQYEINLSTGMSREKFNFILFKFAKSSLTDVDTSRIDTRTSKEDILSLIDNWKSEYDVAHPPSHQPASASHGNASNESPVTPTTLSASNTSTQTGSAGSIRAGTTKHAKPEKYFGSLRKNLAVDDQRLIRLTYELSKNNMSSMPAAGVMLIRSLLDSSLRYQIAFKNKKPDMERFYGKGSEKIDLDEIIKFTINNVTDLFKEPRHAKESLERVQSQHRKYFNSIVHGSWLDPTASAIEGIAGDIRELLRAILSGSG